MSSISDFGLLLTGCKSTLEKASAFLATAIVPDLSKDPTVLGAAPSEPQLDASATAGNGSKRQEQITGNIPTRPDGGTEKQYEEN
jgi:hypothetical protein